MPSFNHVGFNEIMVMTTPPLWSPTYQVGSDGLDNSWQWGQGSEHPRGQGGTFLTHFSSLTNSSAVTILWWKTLPTDFTVQISNCTKKVTFCICPSVCHLLSSFSHVSNQKRSPFPLHCNKCIALCTGNHDLKVSVGLFSMVTLFSLYQAPLWLYLWLQPPLYNNCCLVSTMQPAPVGCGEPQIPGIWPLLTFLYVPAKYWVLWKHLSKRRTKPLPAT